MTDISFKVPDITVKVPDISFKLPANVGPGDTVTVIGSNVTITGPSALLSGPDAPSPVVTVPGPPMSFTATLGADMTSAVLSWLPPTNNGGAPVTSYTLAGSTQGSLMSSPLTVTGLPPGNALWTLAAVNSAGAGPTATTSVVIPVVPPPIVLPFPGFQKANDAAAPGTKIIVPDGTYREAFTVTKAGLTFEAQHPGAVIVDGRDTSTGPIVRQTWALINADHVTFRGLHMQYAASTSQTGSVGTPSRYGALRVLAGHSFFLADACEFDHAYVPVAFGEANDTKFLNCDIHHGDRLAAHGGGNSGGTVGFRNSIVGGKVHDSGFGPGESPENEAGGYKGTFQTDSVFDGVEGYGNHGPAFWMDIYGHRTIYQNLRLHDNTHYGVMEEVSYDAKIRNNVSWHNGWGKPTWGWGAGYLVSSSTGTEVYGNISAWDHVGVSIVSQNRTDWPAVKPPANIYQHDNIVIGRDGSVLIGWFQDWGTDTDNLFANGNHGSGGQFWLPTPEDGRQRWVWGRTNAGKTTLPAWEATPGGGPGGSYLTTAQKDAILAAHGIPTS